MSSKGLERGADGVRRGTARTRKVPAAMSGTVEGDRRGVVPPAQFTVPGKQSLKQALKKGKTPVQATVPPRQRGAIVRQVCAAPRNRCSGTYDCVVPCVVVHAREDQRNHP